MLMSDTLVSAPDALQPATIDFNALHAKAMAYETPDPIAETASPVAAAAPLAELPASVAVSSAASLSPAEQKVLDLPEDAFVRVKVDGQEQTIPVRDYTNGISREAVFTQRMQTLAQQRQQAEAELANQYAYVQQQAQAVAYAQQQLAQYQAAPAAAPTVATPDMGDLATLGDVQSQVQAALEQMAHQYQAREQQFVHQLGSAAQQVQADVTHQRDAQAYTVGLQGVLGKPEYAMLKEVLPYAEESIRYQVAAMDPQSIDQAVSFTEQVAKGWTDKLTQASLVQQQRTAVTQARAKLEPPAGSPPAPSPAYRPGSAFGKNGFDWNALRARAEQML